MWISIIQKIVAPFFLSLIFTTASADEWEIFTGTLIEYDQNVATRNTVEFKNGIELDGRDRVFEKPDIQNKISFGDVSKYTDPAVVDLARELMLEGHTDFVLISSIFGGKSLLAMKGQQQTKLDLSSDYSVIRADTRVDKNGDGNFERLERLSEDDQEHINKRIRKVKERYEAKREELKKSGWETQYR